MVAGGRDRGGGAVDVQEEIGAAADERAMLVKYSFDLIQVSKPREQTHPG